MADTLLLVRKALLMWPGLLWLFALTAIGTAYACGIHAPFFFDDFPNLQGLERLQGKPTELYDLLQYALNGRSSQIGRPISLLSFALQKDSWPSDPEDFLRVNVLIHLLNAALLAICLIRILRLTGLPEKLSLAIGLLTSVLWAAAPIHLGAVLYAVQRMVLLSATFSLLGLLIYLVGRAQLTAGRTAQAVVLMVLGLGVGAGLGVLAKENAALLPLLILVLEVTLFPPPADRRAWRLCCYGLLLLPCLLLAAYLAMHLPQYVKEYGSRGFDLPERLLTESRVLALYLRKILLPPLFGMRMYYDDFPISKSLLMPASTLASLVMWSGLLIAALRLRRRFRFFAFAVLWFLGAHLLESTVVPLEIAFDHRNYLAAIGPLLFLAAIAFHALAREPRKFIRFGVITGLALYASYSVAACWQAATLRSHSLQQSLYWTQSQPDSVRAQMAYVLQLAHLGLVKQASDVLSQSHHKWPENPGIMTMWYSLGCNLPDMKTPDADEVIEALQQPRPEVLETFDRLGYTVLQAADGKCSKHPPDEIERIVQAALTSPNAVLWRPYLSLVYANAAYVNGKYQVAARYLDEAVRLAPTLPLIQQRVTWAVESGDLKTARSCIRIAEEDPRIGPIKRWTYRREIAGMKQLVDIVEDYNRNLKPAAAGS